MANTSLTWTEERMERLKQLWGEGLSASQIAAELGGDVSRNAVLGKAHRLGLAQSASKKGGTPRPHKPTRPPNPASRVEPSSQVESNHAPNAPMMINRQTRGQPV